MTFFDLVDYSVLSKIFNRVMEWMDEAYCHRLRNSAAMARKFAIFNECIVHKVNRTCQGMVPPDAVPPEAINCAGFYDASRWKTCRPDVSFAMYLTTFPTVPMPDCTHA